MRGKPSSRVAQGDALLEMAHGMHRRRLVSEAVWRSKRRRRPRGDDGMPARDQRHSGMFYAHSWW